MLATLNRQKKKTQLAFYGMIIPMAVLFFAFHTFTFLEGIFYSFTNWKGYGVWNFVGLRNYINMFSDPNIGQAYLFTFGFALCATVLVNVLSLVMALLLNSKLKGKTLFKAVFFIPYMMSGLIVAFIFNYMFANILPTIGRALHITALSTNILGNERLAWLGILTVTVWQSVAFNTLIYYSGLQTVDQTLYEAAEIDGASRWTTFFKITFPLIAPFFTINMVLCVKNFLMVFDPIIAMTNGGPGTSTRSIAVLIYRSGFQSGQFAYQSANAVMYFLVIVLISLFQLKVLEKREEKIV